MSVRAIILTYAYGTSKVLAIKSQASLVPSCICEHYPFMHYPSHIPRGKGAYDFGEGVPSSTLSTKAWSPFPASRQKFQDPPLNNV